MEWLFRKFKMPPVNQVILIIILAEFILTTANALVNPVFALFVVQDIQAPVAVVGFAIAIYSIIKSILQLFVARQLDKNHGEIDDHYSMLIGIFLNMVITFLYYFVQHSWQIYALQAALGISDAFYVPPFYAIFTRHLDKEREAFEWSLRSSFSLGAGTALGAALSGVLAATVGIRPLFLINGIMILISFVTLIFLGPYVRPKTSRDLASFYEKEKV